MLSQMGSFQLPGRNKYAWCCALLALQAEPLGGSSEERNDRASGLGFGLGLGLGILEKKNGLHTLAYRWVQHGNFSSSGKGPRPDGNGRYKRRVNYDITGATREEGKKGWGCCVKHVVDQEHVNNSELAQPQGWPSSGSLQYYPCVNAWAPQNSPLDCNITPL